MKNHTHEYVLAKSGTVELCLSCSRFRFVGDFEPITAIESKKFNLDDVVYTLDVKQDELEVRGNALVSGDDAMDKECEDEIIERLNNGDVWAWAIIKVTASWNGIEGVDYLGGCCYKDENDFKQCNDYYDDMKVRALEDLKHNIKAMQEKVSGVTL